LKPIDGMVQLKGELKGELRHACSRCAEDFSTAFNKSFVTAYYKSEDNIKNLAGVMDDIEGSFDVEFLEGNDIDLAEVVHEQVALEIPFQPLCTEHCKGLCIQCGVNLNMSTCNCETGASVSKTSPFEKLRSLKGE
jgi:uncharacterized protein